MRRYAMGLQVVVLVCAGTASGYLWRAALQPRSAAAPELARNARPAHPALVHPPAVSRPRVGAQAKRLVQPRTQSKAHSPVAHHVAQPKAKLGAVVAPEQRVTEVTSSPSSSEKLAAAKPSKPSPRPPAPVPPPPPPPPAPAPPPPPLPAAADADKAGKDARKAEHERQEQAEKAEHAREEQAKRAAKAAKKAEHERQEQAKKAAEAAKKAAKRAEHERREQAKRAAKAAKKAAKRAAKDAKRAEQSKKHDHSKQLDHPKK